MALTLLADRVLQDGAGRTFDLATAEEVRLADRVLPAASVIARRVWRDECQEAVDIWCSGRETLIDFAEIGDARALEIFGVDGEGGVGEVADAQVAKVAIRLLPRAATVGVC